MTRSSARTAAAPSLVWLRQDLRLTDHPGLKQACREGPVIPVYVWSPEEEGDWSPGAASRWWLHHSLAQLSAGLEARGSRLILRRGPVAEALHGLARETGAQRIHFARRYEPAARTQEKAVASIFPSVDSAAPPQPGDTPGTLSSPASAIARSQAHNTALLHQPWDVATRAGQPFQVFTPFWRACLTRPAPETPLPAPRTIPAPAAWPRSLDLDELRLLPSIDWAVGLRAAWEPGEAGARRALDRFLDQALPGYAEGRDRPDHPGTSRLSPHLHFGEISPRSVWSAVMRKAGTDDRRGSIAGAEAYLRELGWREFAYHLLWHFPQTPATPLREPFARFPWREAPRELEAWRRGHTGFPLVDAGLRELWTTGWMHNRVRMVVASFLVKDLLLPWQEGARWFWDTLVDADLANNTLGWQWAAGCGADAAPYFRIFNPVTQAERYDPDGNYTRRWVPPLRALPAPWIHRPLETPDAIVVQSGFHAGLDYPPPIVDHAAARERALAALAKTRTAPGAPAAPAPSTPRRRRKG